MGQVFDVLMDHFEGDRDKVFLWMISDNPMLGDCSPVFMISVGRGVKLLRWMERQIADGVI